MKQIELHTDALRRIFNGTSITCQVVHHSLADKQRVAVLHSSKNGKAKPISVAITFLSTRNWPSGFHAVDHKLQTGALLGQTFREHGFIVQQNRLLQRRFKLKNTTLAALFECRVGQKLEIECYEFWADQHKYGIVLEIKAPHNTARVQRKQLGSHSLLEKFGVSKSTFHNWLWHANPTAFIDRCKIFLARIHGVACSLLLYLRTQQIIDTHFS